MGRKSYKSASDVKSKRKNVVRREGDVYACMNGCGVSKRGAW